MALLTGGIARVLQRAVRGLYQCGTIYRPVRVDDGFGTISEVFRDEPVRFTFTDVGQDIKSAPGYASTDVRVFVLNDELSAPLDGTCKLITDTATYRLAFPISLDPAAAYFDCRGVLL